MIDNHYFNGPNGAMIRPIVSLYLLAYRRGLQRSRFGRRNSHSHLVLCFVILLGLEELTVNAAQAFFDEYIVFAVPEEYQTNKSLARSNIPFNNYRPEPIFTQAATRYQQVYAASAFGKLPRGGSFITRLQFRGGCFGANTIFFSNSLPFAIWMSNTPKAPDALSARFSENIGSNAVLTVTNQPIFVRGDYGPCATSEYDPSWTSTIQLGTPFFYDPSLGNLLIEMQVPVGKIEDIDYIGRRKLLNEIATKTNDVVSRIVATGLTNAVAEIIDTSGLVTQFWFANFPKLSIIRTNSFLKGNTNDFLRVSWATDPSPTRLEYTESLSGNVQWKSYGPPDYVEQFLSFVEFPLSNLKRPRYFRLFWNSPQPGIVQP